MRGVYDPAFASTFQISVRLSSFRCTPRRMEHDPAFRRPCPRTLDRPILIFGLEPEDLVAVGLVGGGLLFVVDPLIAVGAGFGLWILLLKLKAGRPPGYLFYLAYRCGLLLA